jgi:RimJ/RimL family protein N-acetyltransferase
METLPCSREFPASRLDFEPFTLRPFAVSDAPQILAAIEESLPALGQFMPWAHTPRSLEQQVRRLRGGLTINAEGQDFSFGVFRGERFVAGCGLHPRVPLNPGGTEIGFWVRSGHDGTGLATLLTRVLLVYAVEGLQMDRIQICHNVENTRSRRVIEKCGFQPEGIIRNCLSPADPAAVENGLSACRDVCQYALLAAEARQADWYPQVASTIRVYDQVGNDLGCLWSTAAGGTP